jgi:hypothetical protein
MKYNLFTRGALGLGALAATSLYNSYLGGSRAASAIAADRGLPMAYTSKSGRSVRKSNRRAPTRPFNISRRKMSPYKTLRRCSAHGTFVTVPVGGFVSDRRDITLNTVYTTDILAMYRQYRMKKVVITFFPRVSPANSGITNNYSGTMIAACDPDGFPSAPVSVAEVAQLDGWRSKSITGATDKFSFTFYPKVLNSISGTGGVAAPLGSYTVNPWLTLSTGGIAVPHLQLVTAFQNDGSAIAYDYQYTIYFDVR